MRTWHLATTPNTDFERRKSTTLGKEELDDVKAKLDSVHKLLKKHSSFAEDMKAVDVNSDGDLEEDVNFNYNQWYWFS